MDAQKINIVLTGGHGATTAVATIQEIIKRNKSWNLSWIGPKTAIEGRDVPTFSAVILPKFGVKYYAVTVGRLQRKLSPWTISSLLKIPFGFYESFTILHELRPKIIISFGGFAAFPVVVVGWALRIPIIIHEQTVAVGLANGLSSFFARKIAIARTESLVYFPKSKTILTGNPVISSIRNIKAKLKLSPRPVIYITGGSTGSQIINESVDKALPELLEKYYIIHQTGKLDYDHFLNKLVNLPPFLRKNYEVYSFIEIEKIADIFKRADLIIGRAGANTVAEIMVTQRPAILIPIPWTRYDEQTKNARIAEENGNALILKEEDLTPSALVNEITQILKNWKIFNGAHKTGLSDLDRNASSKFLDEIESILREV